jgi:hypothetical protein
MFRSGAAGIRRQTAYNQRMARGWESKSVEDQISEKENPSNTSPNPKTSRAQTAMRQRRDSLMLARAHTMSSLGSTSDARYRAFLERTLEDLDQQIAGLNTQS